MSCLPDVCESGRDPALGDLVVAFEALGVDAEQDLNAVASPFGDLGWGYSPVEPGREARMAKVVRAPRASGDRYSSSDNTARRARSHARR